MDEKQFLWKVGIISLVLWLLLLQVFSRWSGAGYVGAFDLLVLFVTISSLLEIYRKHSSLVALKTIKIIFVTTVALWVLSFLFVSATARYDIPCSSQFTSPEDTCSQVVEKRVVYFAPTNKMLVDGFNDFINTHHVPRLTTLLPGSIPPLSFFFISPWEIGKDFAVAYQRVDKDGYVASVERGDSTYLLRADENVSPFKFYISQTLFPKESLPIFDYYYELFIQNAYFVVFLLIAKEILLYFFMLLNFIAVWAKKKGSKNIESP